MRTGARSPLKRNRAHDADTYYASIAFSSRRFPRDRDAAASVRDGSDNPKDRQGRVVLKLRPAEKMEPRGRMMTHQFWSGPDPDRRT